jgi:O-antigen/teichoic acid export membrane protein
MAKGAGFRAVAIAVGSVLALVASVVLVRSLGVAAYGAIAFALATLDFAGRVADLGTGVGITRQASYQGDDSGLRWARLAVRVSVISGALVAAACAVWALTLHGQARLALLVASPMALAYALWQSLAGLLRARRRVVLVEGSLIAQQVLNYGAAIALVVVGVATVGRVVAAEVVATWITTFLLVPTWLRLTRGVRPTGTESVRRLVGFSLPLLLGGLSLVVLQQSDVILLGAIRGNDAVGLYSPILQTLNATVLLLAALGSYYVPVATRLVANRDYVGLRNAYTVITKWNLPIAAPWLAMMMVAPTPILQFLFGSGYGHSPTLPRLLAIGYWVTVVAGFNGATLTALGRYREIAIRSAVAIVINVLLNFVLISRWGAVGAALGTTIVYAGLNVANSLLIWRAAGTHQFRRDYLIVAAVTLAAVVVSAVMIQALGWESQVRGSLAVGLLVGAAALTATLATASADEANLYRRLKPQSWLRRPINGKRGEVPDVERA